MHICLKLKKCDAFFNHVRIEKTDEAVMDKQQSCSRSPNGTGTICKEMRVMNEYNAIGIQSKKDRLVSVSYLIKIYSLTR